MLNIKNPANIPTQKLREKLIKTTVNNIDIIANKIVLYFLSL